MTQLGRKPLPTTRRRGRQITSYVSESEAELISRLVAKHGYESRSSVIRRGLAALVTMNHPEMRYLLNSDLTD